MASKRKLNQQSSEPGSSKKLCKSGDKRNEHYDESKPDFSQLPTEILEMIFKQVENPRSSEPLDDQRSSDIVNLASVCRRFSDILLPKLKLVSRNQIAGRSEPILALRSYDTIEIISSDLEFFDFEKCFGSSKEKIQKLTISKCRMYDMTLVKLLGVLSNVKSLVIKDCKIFLPKNYADMENMVGPDLKKLESLTLQRMPGPIMRCFGNAKNLQELTLLDSTAKLKSPVQQFIRAHSKKLRSLKVDNHFLMKTMRFPSLQCLKVNNVDDSNRGFLTMAPNLEHLTLTNLRTYDLDGLLNNPCETLKKLKISISLNIEVDKFRKAFPALESIECGNSFKWP